MNKLIHTYNNDNGNNNNNNSNNMYLNERLKLFNLEIKAYSIY